ncbi:MAG: geranylgeranylglycerol-phosphate geranylgeranyltransferase [candidate division KSB1 bacterium]|nr:geranylgeranylglycerol-phosphate geranylgeranyltransferase [candidate division KSB1 bacterium]
MEITRPLNVVISFVAIGVGAVLAGPLQPLSAVLAACVSGALITAAANTVNDVFDIEIDRVNKPLRPLPRHLLGVREAKIFSGCLFVSGVACAFYIGFIAVLIAAVFSVLLYLYSAYLKRMVLCGNFVVSLATAFAFIYGGLAVGHPEYALYPALFAFCMHFAREIIKDIEDQKGDRQGQANTLAVVYGIRPGQWLVTLLLTLLVGLTLVPFVTELYNRYYFWILLVGVYTVLIYTVVCIWLEPTVRKMRFVSKLLKADMLIGLLALYVGRY